MNPYSANTLKPCPEQIPAMIFKIDIANFLSTGFGLGDTRQSTLFQVRDTLADNLSSKTILVDVAQPGAMSNSFEL